MDLNDSENTVDDKPAIAAATPGKSSRFNINRAAGNRLPARGKFSKPTTEASAAAGDDSAVDNDIKSEGDENEKPAPVEAPLPGNSLNRLKNRARPGGLQKTDKPKITAPPAAPRKVNPLLAKRRLQLGPSTTGILLKLSLII